MFVHMLKIEMVTKRWCTRK